MKLIFILFFILSNVVSLKSYALQRYEIFDLGISQQSEAHCINDQGEVAGTIHIYGKYHVFKWSKNLGLCILFESDGEHLRGINILGQLIGNDSSPSDNRIPPLCIPQGGYVCNSDHTITSLSQVAKKWFHVSGINDFGHVCGNIYKDLNNRSPVPCVYDPLLGLSIIDLSKQFSFNNMKYHKIINTDGRINKINNKGDIIGKAKFSFKRNSNCSPLESLPDRGFVKYSNGDFIDLGAFDPVDFNDLNQVLLRPYPYSHGASLWEKGNIMELWTKNGYPISFNNIGEVIGQKDNKAVIWKSGELQYLEDLIDADSGWETLSEANDINNQGQIVGVGFKGRTPKAFLLNPIKY